MAVKPLSERNKVKKQQEIRGCTKFGNSKPVQLSDLDIQISRTIKPLCHSLVLLHAVAMSRHRIHHNVKEDKGVELFDRQPLERFCQPFQSSLEAERKLNGRKRQETREKLQGASPCLTGV